MAKMTMIKAITAAMDEELAHDDKVMIFGEDVGKNGGVFRATDGLQEKYGNDRVFDTPLAESGIIGLANGMALEGFRPVPELQFMGFIYEAFDELAGQMARYRFRMGGTRKFPITVRAPFGGGVHTPELHSDSFEGLLTQVPGLRVVAPSGPYDAKGLLISAIRSDDPVFFCEHMKLYRSIKEEVPDEAYTVPLDKAVTYPSSRMATWFKKVWQLLMNWLRKASTLKSLTCVRWHRLMKIRFWNPLRRRAASYWFKKLKSKPALVVR